MKIRTIRGYINIIVVFLAILGFSNGCDIFGEREDGIPYGLFVVRGQIVSSADNKPVKNISVTMRNLNYEGAFTMAVSDQAGYYSIRLTEFPISQKFTLSIRDYNDLNGAEFMPLDTVAVFKDPVFYGGDDKWDSGITEQELNLKIQPKI